MYVEHNGNALDAPMMTVRVPTPLAENPEDRYDFVRIRVSAGPAHVIAVYLSQTEALALAADLIRAVNR